MGSMPRTWIVIVKITLSSVSIKTHLGIRSNQTKYFKVVAYPSPPLSTILHASCGEVQSKNGVFAKGKKK